MSWTPRAVLVQHQPGSDGHDGATGFIGRKRDDALRDAGSQHLIGVAMDGVYPYQGQGKFMFFELGLEMWAPAEILQGHVVQGLLSSSETLARKRTQWQAIPVQAHPDGFRLDKREFQERLKPRQEALHQPGG